MVVVPPHWGDFPSLRRGWWETSRGRIRGMRMTKWDHLTKSASEHEMSTPTFVITLNQIIVWFYGKMHCVWKSLTNCFKKVWNFQRVKFYSDVIINNWGGLHSIRLKILRRPCKADSIRKQPRSDGATRYEQLWWHCTPLWLTILDVTCPRKRVCPAWVLIRVPSSSWNAETFLKFFEGRVFQ